MIVDMATSAIAFGKIPARQRNRETNRSWPRALDKEDISPPIRIKLKSAALWRTQRFWYCPAIDALTGVLIKARTSNHMLDVWRLFTGHASYIWLSLLSADVVGTLPLSLNNAYQWSMSYMGCKTDAVDKSAGAKRSANRLAKKNA